eukprot:g14376.t1
MTNGGSTVVEDHWKHGEMKPVVEGKLRPWTGTTTFYKRAEFFDKTVLPDTAKANPFAVPNSRGSTARASAAAVPKLHAVPDIWIENEDSFVRKHTSSRITRFTPKRVQGMTPELADKWVDEVRATRYRFDADSTALPLKVERDQWRKAKGDGHLPIRTGARWTGTTTFDKRPNKRGQWLWKPSGGGIAVEDAEKPGLAIGTAHATSKGGKNNDGKKGKRGKAARVSSPVSWRSAPGKQGGGVSGIHHTSGLSKHGKGMGKTQPQPSENTPQRGRELPTAAGRAGGGRRNGYWQQSNLTWDLWHGGELVDELQLPLTTGIAGGPTEGQLGRRRTTYYNWSTDPETAAERRYVDEWKRGVKELVVVSGKRPPLIAGAEKAKLKLWRTTFSRPSLFRTEWYTQ